MREDFSCLSSRMGERQLKIVQAFALNRIIRRRTGQSVFTEAGGVAARSVYFDSMRQKCGLSTGRATEDPAHRPFDNPRRRH